MAKTLLPDPTALTLDKIVPTDETITVLASARQATVTCPCCGKNAHRVHSRYLRTVADLPWQGIAVRFRLHVRKFFCDTKQCQRRIFTEPLPQVVRRYARKTVRLMSALTELTFLVGGEAAARIARAFGLLVSADALLSAVKKTPVPSFLTPKVLGIDDFAFKKGHIYGTILVDLERHCPVDLLPDRDAGSVTAWLQNNPGVEIISRDRGKCYKDGATQGAPDAIQVADRFHLLKNMGDTVEEILKRHHRQIREAAHKTHEFAKTAQMAATTAATTAAEKEVPDSPETVSTPGTPATALKPPTRSERSKEQTRNRRQTHYDEVHALHNKGCSQRDIARTTGLDTKTIRKYLTSVTCPPIAKRSARRTPLSPFHGYIRQRWGEGCHNAAVLLREIVAQGYRGKGTALRTFVKPFRAVSQSQPRSPNARINQGVPAPSVVRWWLLGHSTTKDTDKESWQRDFLEKLRSLCPEIAAAQELAVAFGTMVKERRAAQLDGWLKQAKNCTVPEICSFAKGLAQDEAAIRAALSQEWSNGQVEGQVNRLKLLKRSMYGSACFDLLKARVLHRVAA